MTPADHMDADLLARIYHAACCRSRRQAKRILRDAGGAGTAEELDRVMEEIRGREDVSEIVSAAMRIQERVNECKHPPLEQWIVGRGAETGKRMLVHICPGGSCGFVADITIRGEPVDDGVENYDLSNGMRFTNITWLDGDPPPRSDRRKLMVEAAGAVLATLRAHE